MDINFEWQDEAERRRRSVTALSSFVPSCNFQVESFNVTFAVGEQRNAFGAARRFEDSKTPRFLDSKKLFG